MKIVVTGSMGNISLPLVKILHQKGHEVTLISSDPSKQTTIEKLGLKAVIGSIDDVAFLTKVFTGADAVYTMTPPAFYYDQTIDPFSFYKETGEIFAKAIQASGIKRVVHLSSIGAHLSHGSGLVLGSHEVEQLFNSQLKDIAITFIRPVGFYNNLFSTIPMIKKYGKIMLNYGGDLSAWVSPEDIAKAIAEELENGKPGVRYVASDELTGNETARILGEAIGKPNLQWEVISDEERLNYMVQAGQSPRLAALSVEMAACQRNGKLMEDYYRHPPQLGTVKMLDFAKAYAERFNAI